MKKVSTISLVCAIVLIVAAIVLNVFGFTYINGMRVVRHVGYGYMQMSYYNTSSMTATCLGMIIAGGFLFVSGIMLLEFAIRTRFRVQKCCHKALEAKAEEDSHCCCKAQEEPVEQNQ